MYRKFIIIEALVLITLSLLFQDHAANFLIQIYELLLSKTVSYAEAIDAIYGVSKYVCAFTILYCIYRMRFEYMEQRIELLKEQRKEQMHE